MIYLVLQYLRGILHQFNFSAEKWKYVPTLLLSNHYWREYVIGVNTQITLRKLRSYAEMTNARSKDKITYLYVGICWEKMKSRSKDEITLKRQNHSQKL
jgi:hypothetical protein